MALPPVALYNPAQRERFRKRLLLFYSTHDPEGSGRIANALTLRVPEQVIMSGLYSKYNVTFELEETAARSKGLLPDSAGAGSGDASVANLANHRQRSQTYQASSSQQLLFNQLVQQQGGAAVSSTQAVAAAAAAAAQQAVGAAGASSGGVANSSGVSSASRSRHSSIALTPAEQELHNQKMTMLTAAESSNSFGSHPPQPSSGSFSIGTPPSTVDSPGTQLHPQHQQQLPAAVGIVFLPEYEKVRVRRRIERFYENFFPAGAWKVEEAMGSTRTEAELIESLCTGYKVDPALELRNAAELAQPLTETDARHFAEDKVRRQAEQQKQRELDEERAKHQAALEKAQAEAARMKLFYEEQMKKMQQEQQQTEQELRRERVAAAAKAAAEAKAKADAEAKVTVKAGADAKTKVGVKATAEAKAADALASSEETKAEADARAAMEVKLSAAAAAYKRKKLLENEKKRAVEEAAAAAKKQEEEKRRPAEAAASVEQLKKQQAVPVYRDESDDDIPPPRQQEQQAAAHLMQQPQHPVALVPLPAVTAVPYDNLTPQQQFERQQHLQRQLAAMQPTPGTASESQQILFLKTELAAARKYTAALERVHKAEMQERHEAEQLMARLREKAAAERQLAQESVLEPSRRDLLYSNNGDSAAWRASIERMEPAFSPHHQHQHSQQQQQQQQQLHFSPAPCASPKSEQRYRERQASRTPLTSTPSSPVRVRGHASPEHPLMMECGVCGEQGKNRFCHNCGADYRGHDVYVQ